jgi:hypothetical protein
VRPLPFLSRERRARLFDGCQAALVWLAVLACVVSDPAVERLALAAMGAVALAAALTVLFPMPPETTDAAAPSVRPSGSASPISKEDESHVL